MSSAEQQSEELEVLRSIFDGDSSFSITAENAIHYLFGVEGESRSFMLEIRWPSSYPDEDIPQFNLDVFYNKHLNLETKKAIMDCVGAECETLRGSPMTYSLIEVVKDRFEQLMEKQTTQVARVDSDKDSDSEDDQGQTNKKQSKGDKLTKAQKRKQWDRGGQTNEDRPRGWNWVDVVKHLSQTGNQ